MAAHIASNEQTAKTKAETERETKTPTTKLRLLPPPRPEVCNGNSAEADLTWGLKIYIRIG